MLDWMLITYCNVLHCHNIRLMTPRRGIYQLSAVILPVGLTLCLGLNAVSRYWGAPNGSKTKNKTWIK